MNTRTVAVLATLTLFSVACGKGGVLAAAQTAADASCKCADYDCAKGAVAAFNKISYKESDKVEALSAEDKKTYDAALDRMSECRDKLK